MEEDFAKNLFPQKERRHSSQPSPSCTASNISGFSTSRNIPKYGKRSRAEKIRGQAGRQLAAAQERGHGSFILGFDAEYVFQEALDVQPVVLEALPENGERVDHRHMFSQWLFRSAFRARSRNFRFAHSPPPLRLSLKTFDRG